LSRYRSRWRFFSELGGDPSDMEGARPISDSSPLRRLEQADDRAQLEGALRNLPDHQRVPLVLFHFEEASYDDIAAMLGVSLAKVKTDIHRGREALRRLLDPTYDGSR
jgi:RNA polymerase sigma-70 factor (ECF subfamily)